MVNVEVRAERGEAAVIEVQVPRVGRAEHRRADACSLPGPSPAIVQQ